MDFRVHTANLPELISTIVLIIILRHFTLINELFLYDLHQFSTFVSHVIRNQNILLVMSAHGNGTMGKDNSNDVAWLQINQVLMQASDIKFLVTEGKQKLSEPLTMLHYN